MVAARRRLPVTDLLTLDAPTDSALLWALRAAPAARPARGPAEAVSRGRTEVAAAAPGSRLNLLLTDGEQIVAQRGGTRCRCGGHRRSVVVASEP